MGQEVAEKRSEVAEGGEKEAGRKDDPIRKVPAAPAFSRKGLAILGAVVVLEAATFLVFVARGGDSARAQGKDPAFGESAGKNDVDEFFKVERAVIDLGEIEVPVTSTQPRAPRSIITTVQVVITKELAEKFSGAGGGHGGGGKVTPQQRVVELNLRSIISSMMSADGVRLLEPSSRFDLERKAKDRLNNTQIDADEETAKVLKILRGHVLQVKVDKLKPQSY
jgi:hypothetical protein